MTQPTLTDEQLETLLNDLEIEKAPDSLTQRLVAIPESEPAPASEGQGKSWLPSWLPGWVIGPAFAAAPLALFVALMMQPRTPSDAEVQQARQDLAVAFSYIQGASQYTGLQIQAVLGEGLEKSVTAPLSRHMPYTEQSRKETTS